jgi:hypothetical protein
MRPTALELLSGVRSLLAREVLPAVATAHLRAQVGLAISMLTAAAVELDEAPATYAEERARMVSLAGAALPALERLAPGHPLTGEMSALLRTPSEASQESLSVQIQASVAALDLLDRLAAFCDEHDGDKGAAALGRLVNAELRNITARRLRWAGGGPPG